MNASLTFTDALALIIMTDSHAETWVQPFLVFNSSCTINLVFHPIGMICLVSLVTGLIDQPTGHMQRPDGRKWRSRAARSQGRRGPWLLTVQICSVSNPLGQRPKLTFLLSLFLFCLGKVPAYSPGGKSGGQNKFERAAGGENLNFIFPFDIFGTSSKWVCRQYHSRFNLKHTAKMPCSKIHICSKRRGA